MNLSNTLSDKTPFIIERTGMKRIKGKPQHLEGGTILFCTAGHARISLNMQDYDITPHTEVTILPDSLLILLDADEKFEVILFYIEKSIFKEAHHRFNANFIHMIYNSPIYRHSTESAAYVLGLLDLITRTYKDSENRFRNVIIMNYLRIYMLNMFDKIQRFYIDNKLAFDNGREKIFHSFVELCINNCTRHHDVAFYADKLYISKSYLASVTREIASETPKEIIDRHIVHEIKLLLSFSELTLQQITDRMNFPDQSYMGRFFKRHTGKSPSAYRDMPI